MTWRWAFSTNAFKRFRVEDAIRAIARSGYAGVEILADVPHAFPLSTDRSRLAQIQDELHRAGLVVSNVNAFTLFGASLGRLGYILQHFTPPLCTAIVVALKPWIAPVVPAVDPTIVALKLAFWMVASVLILLATFRRRELGS